MAVLRARSSCTVINSYLPRYVFPRMNGMPNGTIITIFECGIDGQTDSRATSHIQCRKSYLAGSSLINYGESRTHILRLLLTKSQNSMITSTGMIYVDGRFVVDETVGESRAPVSQSLWTACQTGFAWIQPDYRTHGLKIPLKSHDSSI